MERSYHFGDVAGRLVAEERPFHSAVISAVRQDVQETQDPRYVDEKACLILLARVAHGTPYGQAQSCTWREHSPRA